MLPPFHFDADADSDPAFHFDADPDSAFHFDADLASQKDADPSVPGSAVLVSGFGSGSNPDPGI